MKTILIDVDDVICENHFLPVINKYLNTDYKEDNFNNTDYEKDLFPTKKERNKFYDFFISQNSYENCELKKDAYEILEKLAKNNKIILVTNACHYERSLDLGRQFTDKWIYLLKKLPFIPPESIIFTSQKELIYGDIIIDDRLNNLKGSRKYKFLFTCFHNKNIDDTVLEKNNTIRVNNWKELYEKLNNLDIY